MGQFQAMHDSGAYKANDFTTAIDIVRRIENWPVAWGMRVNRKRRGLRLLRFRNGLNVMCRAGTRDWDVIHELLFAQSYARALSYLAAERNHSSTVIDLGGNIGLFSLLAARANPLVHVETFEPGPPNYRLLQMNCLLNPELAERIHSHPEAAGDCTATRKWFFDEVNPGGSSLFGSSGTAVEVQMFSFADILARTEGDISLLKIDVEGAEYAILNSTPGEIWRRIPAISLELHDDPEGKMTSTQFLSRMSEFGYRVKPERVCSFFLQLES